MPNHNSNSLTLTSDAKTSAFLSDYLTAVGLNQTCILKTEEKQESIFLGTETYKKPVRVGAILDALIASQKLKPQNDILIFNGGVLNIPQCVFETKPEGRKSRLTEKEIAILIFLYKNKGHTVSRQDLLTAIWEYAKNVETHTLETHIYRLRQKIENDPSQPTILLTEENGYRVQT